MTQKIDISTSTIFRFILIILGFVFVYLIRDILLNIFIALIIAAAIDGPVDWMAKHKIRRPLGAAIIYVLVFSLFALFLYVVVPPLSGQLGALASNLPEYLNKLGTGFADLQQKIGPGSLQNVLNQINNQLSWAGSNILGAVVNIFGGLVSAGMILVISVYLVIQDKGIKEFVSSVTPKNSQAYVLDLAERVQLKLGSWLRGQLLLMLIVGILSFIGLSLLKVKFALTLALLVGLFEIIPYIGPILGAAPAVALAFLQSPILALLVIALFVVIHQFENYLITPMVMKRAVGLNPLVIIISMIIGGNLGGILGVVVAVPIVATASVFLGDIFLREENK
ncbi:AI-2E family transporter [Patescibacteria group bacterium]|nr:AI-2E family transporter [Patescibacteria group bacterium]MBU2219838.1 AI-2E family transporter [Patescibacteria group bacterium]MBU2264854.1 AI-2E family transporter [Patescibacteria group bacterium]